ncbi:MAG TPA: serine O-acetyltransferase [Dehalococcoidia bacterium]|nr:serine O-acetyltransferase [Dehalococcoidia bacterium]
MGLLSSVRRDIQAALERDPAARSTLEVVLTYPGFHARQAHRLTHALWRRRLYLPARMIAYVSRSVTGIEIHPAARIGDGLLIDHGAGVVIGETAEIGDNCTLYQGVTLGGASRQRIKRHPTLGSNVVVGAGAKIIGAVNVGDNTRIGAGAVVVTNVPPNATVVGVPGHIVAYHEPTDDTILRLPDPEWDRLQELESRVQELEGSLRALEERLGASVDKVDKEEAGARHPPPKGPGACPERSEGAGPSDE